MRSIRVVLVGDEKVGKSSILSSLISEKFVPLAPETTLPECTVPFPSGTSLTIIDTSALLQNRQHLENELRRAHVIAIVFSIEPSSPSFERITSYWLPKISSLGISNIPVILVGNKIDLRRGEPSTQSLVNDISPIMDDFKQVETCVECSAKVPSNIASVFYFALNAVQHPTAPLYDSREHILKPACIAALVRIFKICDVNKDGVLDDKEINEFQRICFNAPLESDELSKIKALVASRLNDTTDTTMVASFLSSLEGYVDDSELSGNEAGESAPRQIGLRNGGLSIVGFIWLQNHFIQSGRLETTWKALRTFGYGEDLSLSESFLFPRFDVPSDSAVELSPLGYQFLTDVFEIFDKDQDGALSPTELAQLFSTTPGNPWTEINFPETTMTTEQGDAVTLAGWLSQWTMTTLLTPKVTLAYLAYLGYPTFYSSGATTTYPFASTSNSSSASTSAQRPTTSALQLTKKVTPKKGKGSHNKNVFLAYVFGSAGCGKSSVIKNFVGKSWEGFEEDSSGNKRNSGRFDGIGKRLAAKNAVANSGKGRLGVGTVVSGGDEKYLILQEFGTSLDSEVLRSTKKIAQADVLIFMYDSSDTNSFSYISNLRQQYKLDDVPSLFVATKSDLDLAQQRHEVQPDTYCQKLKLRVPVAISIKQGLVANLYQQIVNIAIHPVTAIPGGGKSRNYQYYFNNVFYATAAIGGGIAIAIVVWKNLSRGGTTS